MHIGAEDPLLYIGHGFFAFPDDIFVKGLGMIRRSRLDKGRPVALAAVRVQGELGDQQKAPVPFSSSKMRSLSILATILSAVFSSSVSETPIRTRNP